MRSLTITHVDSETVWRGGQRSLLTLAQGLRELGHAQTIVCPTASELANRGSKAGFPVTTKCPRESDIVHAHSGRALNQAFRATIGSSVVRIMTRHVAFAPRHPWIHRFKYTHTCHGIIAVSEAVRTVLLRAGISDDRITVIHTGIELPRLLPRSEATGVFAVGHLGAFTKEKGQEVAIAAARHVPEIRFVLAGDGPLREELRGTAPRSIEFPGFVEDLAAFFARIDLFIMPSRSEAWGLAALEAMSYGVPVVASDIQGLAEIVEPGRNGWLFPVGDAESLARIISDAASDPGRLAAYSQAARERAASFSVACMARETEAFYQRLLAR